MSVKSVDSSYSRNFFLKQHWTKFELAEYWTLSQSDKAAIATKNHPLIYALKMRFFDLNGYFPEQIDDIPEVVQNYVAEQLSVRRAHISTYNWTSRTAQKHNAAIRHYYGYRKINRSDFWDIKTLLDNDLLPKGLSISELQDAIYKFLRKSKWEPNKELYKFIGKTCCEFENTFFNQYKGHEYPLTLLEPYDNDRTILNFIRQPAGRISSITIDEELQKLSYVEPELYAKYLPNVHRNMLQKYYNDVAIATPSSLLVIDNKNKLRALLSCFCVYKGAKILDGLIEIFIRRFKKLQKSAQLKAKEALWSHHAQNDKDRLLNDLVDISLEHPDGIIKDTIYKGVGGKETLEKSKLLRRSFKQLCKELEYRYLSSLYVHHHNKYFLIILKKLHLNTNTHQKLLVAVNRPSKPKASFFPTKYMLSFA